MFKASVQESPLIWERSLAQCCVVTRFCLDDESIGHRGHLVAPQQETSGKLGTQALY